MNRATQIFLACPALLASTLLAHNPVLATEVAAQPTNKKASATSKPISEIVFERPTAKSPTSELADQADPFVDCSCFDETPTLNFTDAESKAAIQRFGCDCAGCLNALRQLQGKQPLL